MSVPTEAATGKTLSPADWEMREGGLVLPSNPVGAGVGAVPSFPSQKPHWGPEFLQLNSQVPFHKTNSNPDQKHLFLWCCVKHDNAVRIQLTVAGKSTIQKRAGANDERILSHGAINRNGGCSESKWTDNARTIFGASAGMGYASSTTAPWSPTEVKSNLWIQRTVDLNLHISGSSVISRNLTLNVANVFRADQFAPVCCFGENEGEEKKTNRVDCECMSRNSFH